MVAINNYVCLALEYTKCLQINVAIYDVHAIINMEFDLFKMKYSNGSRNA